MVVYLADILLQNSLFVLLFEMADKFSIDETIDHILLPDGIDSDLEDSDEEEDEILQQVADDLDPDYDLGLDINAGPLEVEIEEISSINEVEDHSTPLDLGNQVNSQQEKKYRWKKKPYTFPDVSFKGEFSPPPSESLTPMQYFKIFLDDDCMAYVAEQTNLYALAKSGKVINTSAKEIEQFIGILLFTGIFPSRSYSM